MDANGSRSRIASPGGQSRVTSHEIGRTAEIGTDAGIIGNLVARRQLTSGIPIDDNRRPRGFMVTNAFRMAGIERSGGGREVEHTLTVPPNTAYVSNASMQGSTIVNDGETGSERLLDGDSINSGANGSKIKKVMKSKKWAAPYGARCEAQLPLLSLVFAKQNVEAQVGNAMMSTLEESFREYGPASTMAEVGLEGSLTLSGLKFSRSPELLNGGWSTGTGKIQSLFRRKIALFVLREAQSQNNSLNSSNSRNPSADPNHGWYAPSILDSAVINTVHDRKENGSIKKRRGLRDGVLTGGQISEYAIEYLYKNISAVLIKSRRRSNESIFGCLGYMFVDWKLFPVEIDGISVIVDQSTMVFQFHDENSSNPGAILGQIPDNLVGTEWETGFQERLRTLRTVMARYICVVEHDAIVVEGGLRKTVRKVCTIDFVNMATRYLVTYSFGSDERDIFKHTRGSLKAVAIIAYVLYALVKSYATKWRTNGSEVFNELALIQCGNVTLSSLLPGDYRKKAVIKHGKCLRGE